MEFSFRMPANLVFGRGVSLRIGQEAAKLGRRVLIVTGKHSTKSTGLLDRAEQQLKKEGLTCFVFDDVEPNPTTATIARGAQAALDNGCDVVLGLGGGSAMDAAKAIAFCAVNRGDVEDYLFKRQTGHGALPILLVPTTCGTGSEGNDMSMLTASTFDKKSLRGNATYSAVSLIDPALMETLPPRMLASVGFDALCHNMEAYVSKKATPVSDLLALDGVKRLCGNLLRVYETPSDHDAWDQVTFASTLGGVAINLSGTVSPHGLEHPASGKYGVAHGLGLAAVLPACFERTWQGAPERFETLSRLLGGSGAGDCADAVRRLLEKLHIDVRLRDLGVEEAGIAWMSDNCMVSSKSLLDRNPVALTREDVEAIYRASY